VREKKFADLLHDIAFADTAKTTFAPEFLPDGIETPACIREQRDLIVILDEPRLRADGRPIAETECIPQMRLQTQQESSAPSPLTRSAVTLMGSLVSAHVMICTSCPSAETSGN
jgi:hypothetical protein